MPNNITFNSWPWSYWSEQQADSIALSYAEHSLTWQDVNGLVDDCAKQLSQLGVRQEHIVAAISINNADVLWLYLACLRLGACCVVLDPKQGQEQLNDKLGTLAANFIWLADPESNGLQEYQYASANKLVFTCTSAAQQPQTINQPIPTIAEHGIDDSTDGSTVDSVDESIGVNWQGQRLASLVFTSGSSGKAKAVAHCANNHLHSAAGLLAVFNYTSQDSWLLSLPLFHVSGLAIVWRWLFAGGQMVLPVADDSLVEQLTRVTHASLVPTQLRRFLHAQQLTKTDVSLKRILLGGSVIPVALTDKARALGIECWSGYGMTEMASTVTAKHADSSAGVGTLLPYRQLVVDDQQIKVRGDSLGLGYYQRGVIRPIVNNGDWLTTGDLGLMKNGDQIKDELFILGRADNMFISGGENIHPEQIERVLLSHPLINQALVFPVDDAEFGQRPIAVIESTEILSVKTMNQFLQNKLVKFMWPVKYHPLPEGLNVSNIKQIRSPIQLWLTSLHE